MNGIIHRKHDEGRERCMDHGHLVSSLTASFSSVFRAAILVINNKSTSSICGKILLEKPTVVFKKQKSQTLIQVF